MTKISIKLILTPAKQRANVSTVIKHIYILGIKLLAFEREDNYCVQIANIIVFSITAEFGVRFINENWKVLYRELLPFAQSNWDKIGAGFANNIFMKVPYNEILPSN